MLLVLFMAPWSTALANHDSARLDFSVRFGEDINPYRVIGVYLMPGESLEFAISRGHSSRYHIEDPSGLTRATGQNRWTLQAPRSHGLHPIQIVRLDSGETMNLNVFVKMPRRDKRNGRLNGYRVGNYPREPLRGMDIYQPPPGFIEVTPETADALVSPHFRLGQFVSKQGGEYPRYVVLRPRLLLLLEAILEELRAEGLPVATLEVMSGFRTPWYNGHIGNSQYSRHVWGGAADIYIDQRAPHGRMDDLNGDGRSDVNDARWLAAVVDRLQRRSGPQNFMGGIGIYGPRPHRGPFVHVDVRGFEARWEFE
ncbi:hypothetical protein J2T57_003505 [Natronocella acetinitrilica]|uniref:Peptidase M15A C-terminal domain-containing protein n=1 Tax=Natronocella acetinitrilica TaxID=414046 RepID=A0AAE3G632_9GAMM|nr:hypothetical protein [Natronocella acetinitrilica]